MTNKKFVQFTMNRNTEQNTQKATQLTVLETKLNPDIERKLNNVIRNVFVIPKMQRKKTILLLIKSKANTS